MITGWFDFGVVLKGQQNVNSPGFTERTVVDYTLIKNVKLSSLFPMET